ncbi:hypothetical protein [Mechercharimyces sp. CAU 1602]|uniref:hypothetical protein n=1 Tax=Mechercharimyces sp. CAU 1602 TaxID=2973933 RepID=UPI002163D8D7|nr:hypothetical protein [Mechercharimyces sp. CAU 1602]MCS1351097.1 hypothetical protein [Mechercharimyces sp. CAU 1602]
MSHHFSKKKLKKRRTDPTTIFPSDPAAVPGDTTVDPRGVAPAPGAFFDDPGNITPEGVGLEGVAREDVLREGPGTVDPGVSVGILSPDLVAELGNISVFNLRNFNSLRSQVILLRGRSVVVSVGTAVREAAPVRLGNGEGVTLIYPDSTGTMSSVIVVQGNLTVNTRLRRVLMTAGEFAAVIRAQR